MDIDVVVVILFNVPPTAKVIWRQLKNLSNRPVKAGIKPVTPGLQCKWLIHYTTAAPILMKSLQNLDLQPYWIREHAIYPRLLCICNKYQHAQHRCVYGLLKRDVMRGMIWPLKFQTFSLFLVSQKHK